MYNPWHRQEIGLMRFCVLCGLLILATCAWADTIVCLVPPAPSTPTVPRLSMPFTGCQQRTPGKESYAGGHTVSFLLHPLLDGPPLVSPTIDLLFSVMPVISIDGGAPVNGTGTEEFIGSQPTPGLYNPYNTQMVQLNLQAPGGIVIRLDPGPPSLGTLRAQPLPANVTQFSSFFDIFVDLSLDGGNTFLTPSGSTQMVYENTPEPASFFLLLLAVGLRMAWPCRHGMRDRPSQG